MFILALLPHRQFGETIVIDRRKHDVTKFSRQGSSQKTFHRDFREFSAILLVQDKDCHGSLIGGERFRLFLCLGSSETRPRVLLVDALRNAEEAADAAQEINQYTNWPIKFITLDRMVTENDLIWESW